MIHGLECQGSEGIDITIESPEVLDVVEGLYVLNLVAPLLCPI